MIDVDLAKRIARQLREDARKKAHPAKLANVNARGWSFAMSYDPGCSLWMFSAMLWPEGRGSTTDDWEFLGEVLGSAGVLLEAPVGNTLETSPNAVHKWAWTEEPAWTGAPPVARPVFGPPGSA